MLCFGSPSQSVRCKIILLDETELIQEIKSPFKGRDILELVFKHFNLLETVYFGLRYVNSKGISCWLDPSKNVIKQIAGMDPVTFYFGVKFYASDPCKLIDEATRYQFFLQVKQDIQQSRLVVTNELATQLTAYLIQSELGDYDPRNHPPGYVSEFRLVPSQTREFETQVCELHKQLIGQIPSSVELQFLERIKWLDLYGCELHSVVADDTSDYYIGISPHGLIVLKNKFKVGIYFWTRIRKLLRRGKYFMIKVIDKNNDKSTYGFEMPSVLAAKQIHKSCEEHGEFFRLSVSNDKSNGKSSLASGTGTLISRSSVSLAGRPAPALVRIPSRRFQRMGRPDGSEGKETQAETSKRRNSLHTSRQDGLARHNSTPSLVSLPASRHPAPPVSNAYATLPHPPQSERGMFSRTAQASPLSVRSAFVSRYDYGRANYVSHMKRNASTLSLSRQSKNLIGSDNESEVSKSSRHSRRSSRSHRTNRSGQSEDSGTECTNASNGKRQRRSHRRKHNNHRSQQAPELVNWDAIVERRQQDIAFSKNTASNKQSNAMVKNGMAFVDSNNADSRAKTKMFDNGYGSKPELQPRYGQHRLDVSHLSERERKQVKYVAHSQNDKSEHHDQLERCAYDKPALPGYARYTAPSHATSPSHRALPLYHPPGVAAAPRANHYSSYLDECYPEPGDPMMMMGLGLMPSSPAQSTPRVTFQTPHRTAYFSAHNVYGDKMLRCSSSQQQSGLSMPTPLAVSGSSMSGTYHSAGSHKNDLIDKPHELSTEL